jgi:hypothetical protein
VRNIPTRLNLPSLYLDPIAILLIKDLIVKVKQGANLVVFHASIISPADIYVSLANPAMIGEVEQILRSVAALPIDPGKYAKK